MVYELITDRDSPNFTPAAHVPGVYGGPRTIDAITIHHWGADGQRFDKVVDYLCRPHGNTSAHEVIEAGRVAVIVNHRDAAWHTGNRKGNRTTIGLELRPEATDADYATAAERIADLRAFYGDLPLIPHRQWKATACPGVWDLARLDREARAVKATTTATSTTPDPAPTPAPEAPDMILIRNAESGTIALVTGDHTIPLAKVEDVAALRKAGVPQADVTADTYTRIATATQKG